MKKSTAGSSEKNTLRFKPLTTVNWKDLETLFGEKGACGGCWCMTWRMAAKEYALLKGDKNKKRFYELVRKKEPLGILAYINGSPVGWCSVSPKQKLLELKNSRILQRTDTNNTWSIICLFVEKAFRRQNISARLIEAAAAYAKAGGAVVVEAYPVIPTHKNMPDVFAYTGIWKAYEKAGFSILMKNSPGKYIMQKKVQA